MDALMNIPVISHILNLPILLNHIELTRLLHVLFGIVWIGMLYYFNFVQTEYFKVANPDSKKDAVQKLAPRALWWFRWGAALTFLTGAVLLWSAYPGWDLYIFFGALLGTLMAFNVWFVIWPKQKIVIAGKPNAAVALARAGCASRTNTLFSVPMLLFMISASHVGGSGAQIYTNSMNPLIVGGIVVALFEINALVGTTKYALITSVRQVITMSVILSIVLASVIEYI